MRVFNALRSAVCLLGLAISAEFSQALAQSSGCDDISRDVAAAIQKDPSKALMIVEDALVINESCACEIIKAAILASQADSAMVNQIVQTGIAVAPKMSGVIMDCATSVSPGAAITNVASVASVDPTDSEKNPSKNPLPVAPVEEEFIPTPSIRGVYLIQPPGTSFIPCDPKHRKCCKVPTSPCNCSP
ncbi:MAG: hypothetical protein V4599_15535 [Verrucomicrobiota bacterium]